MKTFLMTLALVALVSADVSHLQGYNYKKPVTSYGVPSYQYSGNTGSSQVTYQPSSSSYHTVQTSGSQGYQGSSGNNGYYANSGSNGQYNGNQAAGFSNIRYQTAQPSIQYTSGSANSGYSGLNSYKTVQQSNYAQQYQDYSYQQQQPVQIFKHFYVHSAPEEPQQVRVRKPVALPPAQKHYKVIFIKAPVDAAPAPQVVHVPQQQEEKTIVYVLVKKPEEQQDIVVPQVEQKPPQKPEVFFIKYNNKEETQSVIDNIVNKHNQEQPGSVSFSGEETAPVSEVSGSFVKSQAVVPAYSGANDVQTVTLATVDSTLSGNGYQNDVVSNAGQSGFSSGQYTTGQSGYTTGQSGYNGGQTGFTGGNTVYVGEGQTGFNTISTSQGVPHESYGIPKFRV